MDTVATDSPSLRYIPPNLQASTAANSGLDNNPINERTSRWSSSPGLSTWSKSLNIPQKNESPSRNSGKSPFARITSNLGLRSSPRAYRGDDDSDEATTPPQSGFIGNLTKGIVDSSKSAVKAVQVKARHVVSQNKRRYQEGGFDLDMTYITENIIAMGFPAGDMSSGFFGYVEGFYRNHMEEVIKFFETHHKDNYKVYNLCSERLYDASLFEGKVASFPFDDHNCPPIQLIISFCQSAYSWLKQDIENVVVVHCKAGMARTGLMISSLLLYLKFFPTAEESMDYYNQKRCVDGKGLVLPSQIRYVKYFERVLTYFNGELQPARRCILRGFRLHRCPHWIRPAITVSDHSGILFSTKKHPRTKELAPDEFWFSAPKKGIMVFALPGEPGLAKLVGDFKVHFHDRQGDFYCWLNTMMIENRTLLSTGDLDGFDKRKLPSPGLQVELVLLDCDAPVPANPRTQASPDKPAQTPSHITVPATEDTPSTKPNRDSDDKVKDLYTTNSIQSHPTTTDQRNSAAAAAAAVGAAPGLDVSNADGEVSEFKAMAADASVFSFGDEDDDYESE